jgi:hypothetical protein
MPNNMPNHMPNHIYKGTRNDDSDAGLIVTRDDLFFSPVPSQQLFNHSPDGFEWGYNGSGPAQLALALLLDVSRDPGSSVAYHQEFKRQFVSGWGEEWSISSTEISTWLVNLAKWPVPKK